MTRSAAHPFLIAGRRDRHQFARVQPTGQHGAVQRLDALGIRDRGADTAGEIGRDVVAADRKARGVNEAAERIGRDRRGPRTEIDDRRRQIRFPVRHHRQTRDIGARRNRFDGEMTALDNKHEVADHGGVRRDVGLDAN